MKLYEITELFMRFANMVENGEIEEDAIADTLESIEGELEEKADNIACLIKSWQAEAEAIKAEEKALAERRKVKENQINNLKGYISSTMQTLGKTKIETARNVLSFRKSTALYISNEEWFMQKYPELVKTEIVKSIPKKEVTDLLKAGKKFVGAELVEKQNLQIK